MYFICIWFKGATEHQCVLIKQLCVEGCNEPVLLHSHLTHSVRRLCIHWEERTASLSVWRCRAECGWAKGPSWGRAWAPRALCAGWVRRVGQRLDLLVTVVKCDAGNSLWRWSVSQISTLGLQNSRGAKCSWHLASLCPEHCQGIVIWHTEMMVERPRQGEPPCPGASAHCPSP